MLARQIVVRERMEPIARGDFWVPIAAKARRSIRFFSSPEAERPYLELLRGGFTKELRQRGRERRETNRYLLWLDFERPPDFGAFTEEQLQILDYLDAPNRNVDRYVSAVLGRFGESIPARYGKEGESWLTSSTKGCFGCFHEGVTKERGCRTIDLRDVWGAKRDRRGSQCRHRRMTSRGGYGAGSLGDGRRMIQERRSRINTGWGHVERIEAVARTYAWRTIVGMVRACRTDIAQYGGLH